MHSKSQCLDKNYAHDSNKMFPTQANKNKLPQHKTKQNQNTETDTNKTQKWKKNPNKQQKKPTCTQNKNNFNPPPPPPTNKPQINKTPLQDFGKSRTLNEGCIPVILNE